MVALRVGLELFCEVGVTGLACRGHRNTFDEIGHDHLNVEFDQVRKGVELDITGTHKSACTYGRSAAHLAVTTSVIHTLKSSGSTWLR